MTIEKDQRKMLPTSTIVYTIDRTDLYKMLNTENNNTIERASLKRRIVLFALSVLLPVFIMMAALAGLRITPFGDKTLIIADANGLYINYVSYAGRLLQGLEGIVYSFEKGLGGNMMPHIGGTLLNPFYFLFCFADVTDYPTVYTFVSVLSFSVCGLTMYILLADLYGHKRSNLIFSTSYALIGFHVANVFQAVFFTATQALPLMVLGLRRIFQGKNPLLYILSIAYTTLTSFYFGFTYCVASFCMFLVFLWADHKNLEGRKLSVFIHYCISSLCAGLLPILVWLPGILGIRGGRLDQTSLADFSFWENMPFIEIGTKLFTGANNPSELVNGLPNIFVGILPIALVILFFMNREIEKRKKAAAGILILFYLLSFYIVAFNMLMHGGTSPNWFNYRYSFIFSFILLMVAAYEWQYIDEIPTENLKKCAVIMLLATLIIFSKKYGFVMGGEVLMDFVILLVMFLAYRMHRIDPESNPIKVFEIIVIVLTSLHLMLNYEFSTQKLIKEEGWMRPLSEYQEVVSKVDPLVQAVKDADDSFYRMEINEQRSGNCGNDPMLYGYNGVGHGGSNERSFVRKGLNKLGIGWYDMRNYYAEGIPAATDTLLGLKYIVAKEDLSEEKGYVKVTDTEDWNLYHNPNALPVAFLSNDQIVDIETDFTDVFENLNLTWTVVTGEQKQVFLEEEEITFSSHNYSGQMELTGEEARAIVEKRDTELEASVSAASNSDSTANSASQEAKSGALKEAPEYCSYIEYTWTARQDGPVYSYNRSGLMDTSGSSTPVLNYEGYYHKGDTVTGYLPVYADSVSKYIMEDVSGRFRAAYADEEALAELSKTVTDRPTSIHKIKDRHLTGEFTADENQKLMFTIPYDTGWTLTVDGEKVELQEILGVLMMADVEMGTHQYEMKYTPDGLRIGEIISAITFVIILIYIPFGRQWLDKKLAKELKTDVVTTDDHNRGSASKTVDKDSNDLNNDESACNEALNAKNCLVDKNKYKKEANRLYGLDFLKILATILILLHHYQQVHNVRFEEGINFYYGKFYFGWIVELFFVISGFMMSVYIERIRDGLPFGRFMKKRYLRFQPLMLISVLCTLGLMYLFETAYGMPWDGMQPGIVEILISALGLQALWNVILINNPLWYIGVLLVCYVIMYSLISISKHFSIPCQFLFAAMIVLGIIIFQSRVNSVLLNVRTARGLYSFFWGLLLADILHRREPARLTYLLSTAILIGFPILIAFADEKVQTGVNYTLTFVYYTAAILVFTSAPVTMFFKNIAWTTVANISYNAFVWHSPLFIMYAVYFFWISWVPDFTKITTMICMVIGIYLFGTLSYYLVDRPFRKMLIRE